MIRCTTPAAAGGLRGDDGAGRPPRTARVLARLIDPVGVDRNDPFSWVSSAEVGGPAAPRRARRVGGGSEARFSPAFSPCTFNSSSLRRYVLVSKPSAQLAGDVEDAGVRDAGPRRTTASCRVRRPALDLEFSFTASQNLDLPFRSQRAGATPSAPTTSPTVAVSGTFTTFTESSPFSSHVVARIMASEAWPASWPPSGPDASTNLFVSSAGDEFSQAGDHLVVFWAHLHLAAVQLVRARGGPLRGPRRHQARLDEGSSSLAGCGVFGAFSFFSFLGFASPAAAAALAPPSLGLITGLSMETM